MQKAKQPAKTVSTAKVDVELGRQMAKTGLPNYDDNVKQDVEFIDPHQQWGDKDVFEVETLLDRREKTVVQGGTKKTVVQFLVKWKGYDESANTWEEASNLACEDLIKEYYHKIHRKERKEHARALSVVQLHPQDTSQDTRAVKCPTRQSTLKEFRQLVALDMNQGVTVVNDVDDVGAPEGYVFLNRVLYGKDVPRPLVDQLPSCECTDCGETATDPTLACMCVERSGGVMMYDQHERLIDLTVREIIQECTEKCACTMMCHNRVVQRGRQVDLEIFRTPNRGWGVRADEDIPAGTFVEVYTGEVLTIKEVMDREDFYDSVCYTFELDMHISYEDDDGDDEPEYVIDAFNMGNVSHFFNHSCEPNMETRAVRWDHHDPAIYNLAFFTIRPVMEGEEMCFDYYPGQERTPPEDKELSPCLCGARTCRKWILL